jgi:hypothetical protein
MIITHALPLTYTNSVKITVHVSLDLRSLQAVKAKICKPKTSPIILYVICRLFHELKKSPLYSSHIAAVYSRCYAMIVEMGGYYQTHFWAMDR